MGANRLYSLFRVLFPRALPEVYLSWIIIFILSIGFYITPELLGGGSGSTMMMGVLISEQVIELGEWGFGSFLSIILVATAFLCLGIGWLIYNRLRTLRWN